ncbi:MAG TPA: nucleoside deaminase [Longilinea sp.]|nr:nucleoside deaminase [Longilinea sp.]
MENDFDAKIQQQVERLQQNTCRQIEAEVSAKRIAWVGQNCGSLDLPSSPSPRQAYELLFEKYMGLALEELPVVAETDTRIEWLSTNPCPTLEACSRLKLDTRKVCRAAYEKSTQAFLSQLDPQLRFLRSYDEIRPYAHHCREMIVRIDFEAMMRLAIEEAKLSKQEGNKGYGAVVVWGKRIIGKAHDTAATEKDPSLHAEVNAIRQAVHALGDANLSGAVLISTCEPCPMCSSLAVWSNLTAVVYGASIEKTAGLGKSRILVTAREIADKSPVALEIIDGVLENECISLYT